MTPAEGAEVQAKMGDIIAQMCQRMGTCPGGQVNRECHPLILLTLRGPLDPAGPPGPPARQGQSDRRVLRDREEQQARQVLKATRERMA